VGTARPQAASLQFAFGIDRVETERLVLCRPVEGDFADVAGMFAEPRVAATLGGVRTGEQARVIFDRQLATWTAFGFGLWTVRDRATGAFAGRGGLRVTVLEGRAEAEVGYAFLPEYWGRGLATELARESVRVAFEVVGFRELVCFALPTNAASRRVMEKVGFSYERDGEFMGIGHVFYRLKRPPAAERQAESG
jgi:ribosomal-protein-alanine N-acetyltransferase